MIKTFISAALAALFLFISSFSSHANDLIFSEMWARQSIPGADNGVAYGVLKNVSSNPIEIVAVESSVSRAAEVHEISEYDGQMRMRRVKILEILPDEEAQLAPGGLHFMLFGLQRTLSPDEEFEIQVTTSTGATFSTKVQVKAL